MRRIVYSILLIAGVLAIWAFWIEPASIRIREESIAISDWPVACDGMRTAVLADLHVGSPHKGLKSLDKLVEQTNSAQPDLILLPGDFVIQGVLGGSFVAPEAAAEVLSKLKAPMGVYAVLGNHDWWLDAGRVQTALVQNNISVLEDRSHKIVMKECHLRLAGISDYWEGEHDVEKALEGIDPQETVVAFTHNPDIFPEIPSHVALTVAGHTHGGQVYLPGLGRPIVPSVYNSRFAIGHIVESGRHLYVSSGVGTSILPVRFLVPPEITILEVRKQH